MRTIFILLGLLFSVAGFGQQQMLLSGNGENEAGILDTFPGATHAYSLYRIRAGYTGECLRLYNASNNAITDIGFRGNYVDTLEIISFCSGANCRVIRWYDQSGNADDLISQDTVVAPLIADSTGALIKKEGQLALFAGDRGEFNMKSTNPIGTISEYSIILVGAFQQTPVNFNSYLAASDGVYGSSNYYFLFRANATTALQNYTYGPVNKAFINLGAPDTDQHLFFWNYIGSTSFSASKDGSTSTDVSGIPASLNNLNELDLNPIIVQTPEFYYQEIIMYSGAEQSSNQTQIQTSINNRYNIY